MNDFDLLYQDVVLDHKRHPRHYGALPDAPCEAHGHNPLCGDSITLRLREAGGRITDIAFEGQGCAICIASTSMLTEAVHGRTLADAERTVAAAQRMLAGDGVADEALLGQLVLLGGVRHFPSRIKCAALGWHALGECLRRAEATKESGDGCEA